MKKILAKFARIFYLFRLCLFVDGIGIARR